MKRNPHYEPLTARELAFAVLEEHRTTGKFLSECFNQYPALEPQERRFAREMAQGVVRRNLTLDAILKPFLTRSLQKLDPPLRILLQLGVYQLLFLTVPPHAAVHETVEVSKKWGRDRWTGFLNGVLRSVGRNLSSEEVHSPARNAVPTTGGHYVAMTQTLFPNPDTDRAGYFSEAFSFPRWLVDRWLARWDWDQLLQVGFSFNTPAPLCLRVNMLKTTPNLLVSKFAEAGVNAQPGQVRESIWLLDSTPLEQLPGFHDGLFAVQDESAIQVSRLLDPKPHSRVLDLCSAPGTKTTHIAELMHNSGLIIACDVNPTRLLNVVENCDRLGIDIVQPHVIDDEGKTIPPGPFDAILVDAPCSNTGVLGKRPEARWRVQEKDVQELSATQLRLLDDAHARLKPGGRLVYSTCSLEPEENDQVVEKFLAAHPEMQLKTKNTLLPEHPRDGGFHSLMEKLA